MLDGARPDFVPADPWIRRWEGWVLGQTALRRLDRAMASGGMARVDLLLAQKYAGAAGTSAGGDTHRRKAAGCACA